MINWWKKRKERKKKKDSDREGVLDVVAELLFAIFN